MSNGMFCPNCGKGNVEGARFCFGCGASLTGDSTAPSGAIVVLPPLDEGVSASVLSSRMSGQTIRTIVIIAAIAAAVIILLASGVLGFLVSGPTQDSPNMRLTAVFDDDFEQTHLIYDGKSLDKRIEGRANISGMSEDGSVYLLTSYMTGSNYENEIDVYYFKNGKVTRIGNEISNSWLSKDGKTAYLFSDDSLYSMTLPDGEKKKIRGGLDNVYSLIFSNDGMGVLYTGTNYEDGGSLYYYRNGENTKIGDYLEPRHVSNKGEIYYYDSEREALYYMSGPEREKERVVNGNGVYITATNGNDTQMLVSTGTSDGNNRTYFVERGKENARVSGFKGPAHMLLPQGIGEFKDNDLRQNFFIDYNEGSQEIRYLNKNLETDRIASDVRDVRLSADTNILFYIRSGSLFKMNANRNSEPERIAREIVSYEISANGRMVYYLNEDDELYYKKGTADPIKITDDVKSIKIAKNETLYYLTDYSSRHGTGSLYTCKTEKDKKRIDDDVYSYQAYLYMDYTVYSTKISDDEYDIYAATSGGKFECVLEGINGSFSY